MSLRYYREEEARHPAVHATKCTTLEAVHALKRLAVRFKVPLRSVRFTSGRRHSRATGIHSIVLNQDVLNWLLVAHEFAHCWEEMRARAKARQLSLSAKPGWQERVRRIQARHYHGKAHAKLTDRCIAYMLDQAWLNGRLAQEIERDITRRQERERQAAQPPSRDDRIARRLQQVARLERKIRALSTRLRTARRSLGALQRAAARQAEVPE